MDLVKEQEPGAVDGEGPQEAVTVLPANHSETIEVGGATGRQAGSLGPSLRPKRLGRGPGI